MVINSFCENVEGGLRSDSVVNRVIPKYIEGCGAWMVVIDRGRSRLGEGRDKCKYSEV